MSVDAGTVPSRLGESFELELTLKASGPLEVRLYQNKLCGLRIRPDTRLNGENSAYIRCHGKFWSNDSVYEEVIGDNYAAIVTEKYSPKQWHKLSPQDELVYTYNVSTEILSDIVIRYSFSDEVFFDLPYSDKAILTIDPAYPLFSSEEGLFLNVIDVSAERDARSEDYFVNISSVKRYR